MSCVGRKCRDFGYKVWRGQGVVCLLFVLAVGLGGCRDRPVDPQVNNITENSQLGLQESGLPNLNGVIEREGRDREARGSRESSD